MLEGGKQLLPSAYHQQWTQEGLASALPVTGLSAVYRLLNHLCHCQFSHIEQKLSNLIGANIGRLRVLVPWILCNWPWLTWSWMSLQADWSLELSWNYHCYWSHPVSVLSKRSCFCKLSPSIPDNFSFVGIAMHSWPIAYWSLHVIVSVTVNLNW